MRRLLPTMSLALALVVPATTAAAATSQDRSEGKRECSSLFAAVKNRADFVAVVKLETRSAVNGHNAFGTCVKLRSNDAARERRASQSQAVEFCRAQEGKPGSERGRPSDPSTRNDFGQCVRAKRHELNAQKDAEQRAESVNPAKKCRAMKTQDRPAYEAAYGTGKNAFGKCVSDQAKKQRTS